MDSQVLGAIFQLSGKFISHIITSRPAARVPLQEPQIEGISQEIPQAPPIQEEKATGIEAGCLPCALGHTGTCSGLLNEAVRFAKGADGVRSPEVIERVNICLDELNAMERVDLRPEKIISLPGWQKDLANRALEESRKTRHALEGMNTLGDLEHAAAGLQTTRNDIGKEWFQRRLQEDK